MPCAFEGGAADEDLATARSRPDAGCEVHASTHVVEPHLVRRGGVETDAHRGREALLVTMRGKAPLDGDGGLDRSVGIREGEEEAVAGGLDLLAALLRRPPHG